MTGPSPFTRDGIHGALAELHPPSDRAIEAVISRAVVFTLEQDPIVGSAHRDGYRADPIRLRCCRPGGLKS
jgi:hypothetical protein